MGTDWCEVVVAEAEVRSGVVDEPGDGSGPGAVREAEASTSTSATGLPPIVHSTSVVHLTVGSSCRIGIAYPLLRTHPPKAS
jgi:hypothetical protein